MKGLCLTLLPACSLLLSAVGGAKGQSYTFTTVAGLAGSSGSADGTNSDARFNYPCEIAVDSSGVLYVSDLQNHTIRQLTPMGTNWVVTTIAGLAGVFGSADGTNSDARFNRPNGLVLDPSGALYVADHYNATVRKLTHSGTNWSVTTVAGSPGVLGSTDGTNGGALFWGLTGVALDRNQHLYVADTSNFIIRNVVAAGTNWVVTTLAGTALAYGFTDATNGFAEFDYPYNVVVAPEGVLYVTDLGNNAIRQVAPLGPDWVTTTVAGFSGLLGTNDGPGTVAAFNSPNGLTVDAATNLFVTDQFNHTIRKLAPSGNGWVVSTVAGVPGQRGSLDGPGATARFNKPWGIAVDNHGTLFVVDYLNHTIRQGTPVSVPSPTLQIARAAGQVVLSWPVAASNYVIETTTYLQPSPSWTAVTSGIVLVGTNLVFTNSPSAAPAFFRLHKQ